MHHEDNPLKDNCISSGEESRQLFTQNLPPV